MSKPLWDDPDPNVDAAGRVLSPVPGVKPGFAFGAHPRLPNRYKNPQNRHTGCDWPGMQGASVVMVGNVSEEVAGVVTHVTYDDDYGNSVQVARDGHVWRFCHLSRVDVKRGQRLRANEQIGLVGQTGHVFGPHLHLELSRGSSWAYNDVLDPTKGW
jgi:murein DD-endopeptidase MepM/ murein hydrolase activator NlpD